MLELIDTARTIATKAHAKQTRWNGDPYITHPERVAQRLNDNDPVLIAAALLHDVVEDTPLTIDDLRNSRIPDSVCDVVELLTKKDSVEYTAYIKNIGQSLAATKVKMADLEDNMSDLDPTKNRGMLTKYQLAYMYLEIFISKEGDGYD